MRVKTGFVRRRRHKKMLALASGYYAGRSRHFRKAKEQVEHALCYAFRDRKRKKRDFRRLWIIRINAAARLHGFSYSTFMYALSQNNINIDRKILADMAMNDPQGFEAIAKGLDPSSKKEAPKKPIAQKEAKSSTKKPATTAKKTEAKKETKAATTQAKKPATKKTTTKDKE